MGWTYYLIKIGMFATFVALLYFAIGAIMGKVSSELTAFNFGANVLYILSRFKICEAVNIYISAVVSTWIINKIINYWM